MSPTTVEARYAPSMNSLTISAGILHPPFFDSAADPGVNFGAIGVVVGHELIHGFDGLGSKFDESGNMRDWQTSDDRKEFAEAASCQVAEYSKSRAVSDPDDLPVKGNGQLTLAENTADNGGLRIAFRALTDALVAQKKTARPICSRSEASKLSGSILSLRSEHDIAY